MFLKKRNRAGTVATYILLTIIAVSVLIPFVYILLISFGKGIFSTGNGLLPRHYTIENYVNLFTKYRFSYWLANSIIVAAGTTLVALVVTSLSAYAFSRLHFKGRDKLFSAVLLVQVFPLTLSMVSIFKILNIIGLISKLSGLTLVDSTMTSASLVLLAKGYFDRIPYELDEAAQIDGASRLKIFYSIILPLVKPMLAIIAVQSFVLAYNEYALANVIMTGGFKSMPLAVGLQSMMQGQYATNWSAYCAAAVIGSIPMILIFYSMQNNFISGLSEGGVKE